MTSVRIDLNVRVRSNQAFAAIADADGPLAPGATVEVVEPESQLSGTAVVTEIDEARDLVYLSVGWGSMRERALSPNALTALIEGIAL